MSLPSNMTDRERGLLESLADALIPRAPGRLSASEAGIAGPLLAEIEAFAPERLDLILHVIREAEQRGAGPALAHLHAADGVTYDLFCETIAGAYFMAPEVRAHVGYPGRVGVPARIDVSEIEDLLMPVLDGGFAPRAFPQ
jgi:hypothetical protein